MNTVDIIMYKNGLFKEVYSTDKYIEKKEDIAYVLLNCFSEVLGEFYVPVKHKVYKKFNRVVKNIELKYDFVNDIITTSAEEDGTINTINFAYQYQTMNELMTKVVEIIISEGPLADLLWSHESWFCYIYENINIKIKNRDKSKEKFTLSTFLSSIYGKTDYLVKGSKGLMFNGRKAKYLDIMKFKDLKTKSDLQLIRLYGNILVPVDFNYVAKIGSLSIESQLYVADDGIDLKKKKNQIEDFLSADTSYNVTDIRPTLNKSIGRIWELPMTSYVIEELVYDDVGYQNTKLISTVSCSIDGKEKTFKNWTKLYDKLFSQK